MALLRYTVREKDVDLHKYLDREAIGVILPVPLSTVPIFKENEAELKAEQQMSGR
tara:strand:- start:806 stop:970 length:165 start_codon:yes stop_codon:yes gene_type:complete